ncbi:PP2C family protein-serine/threonine phosphatase [Paenibacillus massiliensis]|uniref:PP2C family protein-serine/threonine phosphatase n=1 Tax=Paenibacillus massiliensis TaxID=225917 RepID=UPI0004723943|nr:serine/threonine protein phosphatase [Paenibacillus massiliensis]
MRKENSDFQTAFVSEAGSYLDNRDYFAYIELDDMACYVLADGLDSDQELRSAEMAVKTMLENFMEKPSMSRRRMARALQEAQEWLQFESRRVRLKTSLLMIVTNYNKMVYVSCGHVRLYHFRAGRLNFRSKDHSLAQSMADDGRIPEEATSTHEERGNLLEYVGKPGRIHGTFSKKSQLADGDVLLLATPGMWEGVELAEMLGALEQSKDATEMTDTLEEVLLSKQQRVVNNYTAAAIYVNKVFQEKKRDVRKLIKRIAIALVVLLLLGGGATYMAIRQAAQKAQALEDMVESALQGDEYARNGDYLKAVKSYSEARNAAIKINDKVHRNLYGKEQKVSQTLVDGDEYAADGDFEKAKSSYEKALKDSALYPPFQGEDIQKKIDQLDGFAKVAALQKEADLKFQGGSYQEALELYQQANLAATETEYTAAQKELQTKLADTEGKLKAINQEVKEIQAGKLEARAERLLKSEDYAGAVDAYAKAQEIYQEIGKLESVLAMERSIAKAEDKASAASQAMSMDAGSGLDAAASPGAGSQDLGAQAASAASTGPAHTGTSQTSGTQSDSGNSGTTGTVETGGKQAASDNQAAVDN